ncbi:hypothetical protein BJY52DRAFT_1185559 [Lactarius psammicola]|nr:hypothetical protein BJY52DRAFT_1185559 [Lactarius psammicola]
MPGSPVADIRNSFGAAFVGLLVSTTLFGLTIVQTWIYFWHYRDRDPKALKFFIAFIAVMDALHTILCAYAVYWYLVLNFGNVENLGFSMWALDYQVIVSIFVGVSVQLYYTKRVYKVSQSTFIPVVIVALVAVGSSLGCSPQKRSLLKQFAKFHSLIWIPCVGMSAGALADLLIAAAMCWFLYRKRTGFARQARPFDIYAYQFGFVDERPWSRHDYQRKEYPSQYIPFDIFLFYDQFVVSSSSLIWMAFYWAMSYVNSLLAMLNSRDYVRDRSTTDIRDKGINLSSIRIEPPNETYGPKSSQPGVSVTVHRSTTSNFGRNKSDHDVEPTFEVPKPDASVIHFQSQGRSSGSSA